MKWINGRTRTAKIKRRQIWRKWFAWFPVKIAESGTGEEEREVKVWLQFIERKKDEEEVVLGWMYREISKCRDEYERIKKRIEEEDIQ